MVAGPRAQPRPALRGVRSGSRGHSPRPGALLASAAAVPLGAAALYAAGLLEWWPRLIFGAALVVLGTAIRRTERTVTGARIGRGTSRAIGMAVVVGGALAIGGALVSAVTERGSGSAWAPLLLCAALGAAGAWIARDRPAIGGVVAAVAATQAWLVLLDVLRVGPELTIVLIVLPAAGLAAAAVRGVGPPPVRAGLGTAAALLIIARTTTEFTGISMLGIGLVPTVFDADARDPATGWLVAQVVLAQLTLVVLLATAFVRRDPVGGALAGAALLVGVNPDDTAMRIAYGAIPALAVAVLSLALRSAEFREWLTERAPAILRDAGWNVSPDVVRGAWTVALVIGVATVVTPGSSESRVLAGVAVAVLAVAVAAAWSTRGPAGIVAASVTLVALGTIQPFWVLLGKFWTDDSDGFGESGSVAAIGTMVTPTTTGVVVGLGATVLLALVLFARIRAPAVAAAAIYAVLMAASTMLFRVIDPQADALWWTLMSSLAPMVVLLVIAAGCAVAGPARWLAQAQAVAAVCAGAAMAALFTTPTMILGWAFEDGAGPLPDRTRLVMVLLLVSLAFGGTLLAASTARRASTVAALGAIAAAFGTAVLAATVSAALSDARVELPADPEIDFFVPLTPVLGFDWGAGLLRVADPGWPVLFGIVGLVLLGAATWLESRRPVPADAPLAPREHT